MLTKSKMDPRRVVAETIYSAYLATIKQGGEIPPVMQKQVLDAIRYLINTDYFKEDQ